MIFCPHKQSICPSYISSYKYFYPPPYTANPVINKGIAFNKSRSYNNALKQIFYSG